MDLTLHGYWRSSAVYRVRIGLNLKGLSHGYCAVNLLDGAQRAQAYRALNPQGLIPALETGDGRVIAQSLAILEWLDETTPEPPLLPGSADERAVVRAMAGVVASDIHPLNNLRVIKALAALGIDQAARDAWSVRWMVEGFTALEAMVARHGRGFAFGDTPTLADCCLVPQLYNARRFNADLTPFPRLVEAAERCAAHPAFAAAHPDQQPDAPAEPRPA